MGILDNFVYNDPTPKPSFNMQDWLQQHGLQFSGREVKLDEIDERIQQNQNLNQQTKNPLHEQFKWDSPPKIDEEIK